MTAPDRDLGNKTARGVVWAGAQMLLTKLASMGGQVVLARFLLQPRDFGLIGLALTVTSFTSLIQQVGLRDVLVHRHRSFDRWSNVAFWMSLPMTVGAATLTVAVAPLAARLFHQPGLTSMLAVSSIVVALNGLSIVPSARLQNDLRFRLIGCMGLCEAFGVNVATVLLAVAGLGPYCVPVALAIGAFVRVCALWKVACPRVRLRPELSKWRYLVGASAASLGAGLAITLVGQGDYIAIGLFHDAKTVGCYFFAYNLSIHIHIILSAAFVSVLQVSLSKLRSNPERQLLAFLSVSRLIAAVGTPLCLFQAAFAAPIVHLLFGRGKWEQAIPLFQLLSTGMAFRIATGPAHSMIKAQGRFTQFLTFAIVYCTSFEILAVTASRLGGARAVACVVAACMALFDPALIALCIRNAGGSLLQIGRIYGPPLLAGVPAVSAAALLRPVIRSDILGLIVGLGVTGIVYAALIRIITPTLWQECLAMAERLLLRTRGESADDRSNPKRNPTAPMRVQPSIA